MGLKRKQLRVKPKDLVALTGDDGTVSATIPITSDVAGVEGSLSFTLTDDMVLRVVWDGVGLSGFSAWSTQ